MVLQTTHPLSVGGHDPGGNRKRLLPPLAVMVTARVPVARRVRPTEGDGGGRLPGLRPAAFPPPQLRVHGGPRVHSAIRAQHGSGTTTPVSRCWLRLRASEKPLSPVPQTRQIQAQQSIFSELATPPALLANGTPRTLQHLHLPPVVSDQGKHSVCIGLR